MGSWIAFAQNAAQFIVGPFGISIFAVILGWAGIRVAIEHRWHAVGYAIAGGVITFGAAWAVQTFMVA
jgi:hypothetical protein